jgi:hypothetical protein
LGEQYNTAGFDFPAVFLKSDSINVFSFIGKFRFCFHFKLVENNIAGAIKKDLILLKLSVII